MISSWISKCHRGKAKLIQIGYVLWEFCYANSINVFDAIKDIIAVTYCRLVDKLFTKLRRIAFGI